jgi:hypothetical protein
MKNARVITGGKLPDIPYPGWTFAGENIHPYGIFYLAIYFLNRSFLRWMRHCFSVGTGIFVKTRMSDIFSGITGILTDFFQRLVFHPLQVSAQAPHQFPITGIC